MGAGIQILKTYTFAWFGKRSIVRRFSGDNLRRSLPWVTWLGALLLLVADVIARWVRYLYEVPVSTVFGIIGAALFFYLLLKPVRHAD